MRTECPAECFAECLANDLQMLAMLLDDLDELVTGEHMDTPTLLTVLGLVRWRMVAMADALRVPRCPTNTGDVGQTTGATCGATAA